MAKIRIFILTIAAYLVAFGGGCGACWFYIYEYQDRPIEVKRKKIDSCRFIKIGEDPWLHSPSCDSKNHHPELLNDEREK